MLEFPRQTGLVLYSVYSSDGSGIFQKFHSRLTDNLSGCPRFPPALRICRMHKSVQLDAARSEVVSSVVYSFDGPRHSVSKNPLAAICVGPWSAMRQSITYFHQVSKSSGKRCQLRFNGGLRKICDYLGKPFGDDPGSAFRE